ncbi:MAG: hypothetical protein AAGA56_30820 [Myxococcota bacterium]
MKSFVSSSASLAMVALLSAASCSSDESGPSDETVVPTVVIAPAASPFPVLSEWGLFSDVERFTPSPRVIPYDVVSPFYSDYAYKRRFLYIPEGETIGYDETGLWRYPVGTILVKTFSYLPDLRDPRPGIDHGEQLLETRLLVRYEDEWKAHTYVYDGSGDARRRAAGTTISATWIDVNGQTVENEYIVPNTNECAECHGESPAIDTLGGRTRQFNRDFDYGMGAENQIDHLASLGLFDRDPPAERETLLDPFGDGPLFDRVRSYLDTNCAACHSTGRAASQSALLLGWEDTAEGQPDANWGRCKPPTSAGGATCGHTYDVVPGDPAASIMICRLESVEPKVKMPPLASRVAHTEAVALISEWIAQLPADDCQSSE